MRRVPIRMKLAGALVVPLVALVVVTALEVLATYAEVDEVHDQAELATSSLGPPSLLSKLEDERNAAAVYLIGLEDAFALPVEDNAEAWAATDQALESFRSDVGRRSDVADTYQPALDALDDLGDIRASVEGSQTRGLANMAEASEVFDRYSSIMDTLFATSRLVMITIQDADLRRGAELADLSARQTDLLARITRDLMITQLSGAGDGVNQQEEIIVIGRQLGLLRTNETLIDTKARGEYGQMAEDLFADPAVQEFPTLVSGAIQNRTFDLLAIAETAAGEDAESFGYTVFRGRVVEQLQAEVDEVRAAADARLRQYVALATLATLAALLATWLVSRSITRPLRSLTRQATEMADDRLPSVVLDILETPLGDDVQTPETVPVTVRTRDEVADVAAALNTVQDTAVDLAAEQAVLRRNIADSFVNLGRRNQNLLGRQLDFITELESNETDPDTLGSLFRLDHLATRMRRNAESLLVLAGIDPPRKWAAPVRVSDVIRSALGEVEDYQRVTMGAVEPATIIGSAAADLAHLVAEFVENALTFSAPEQSVGIRGVAAGGGDPSSPPGGGYRLTVTDAGFGMPEEDIVQANRRLTGTESFTIAPSKYLGHYVAGNLAERHGIRLGLHNAPGGGITATIDLPPALLTADTPAEGPSPALPAPRARALVPVPALAAVGAGGAGVEPRAASSFLTPGAPGLLPTDGDGDGGADAYGVVGPVGPTAFVLSPGLADPSGPPPGVRDAGGSPGFGAPDPGWLGPAPYGDGPSALAPDPGGPGDAGPLTPDGAPHPSGTTAFTPPPGPGDPLTPSGPAGFTQPSWPADEPLVTPPVGDAPAPGSTEPTAPAGFGVPPGPADPRDLGSPDPFAPTPLGPLPTPGDHRRPVPPADLSPTPTPGDPLGHGSGGPTAPAALDPLGPGGNGPADPSARGPAPTAGPDAAQRRTPSGLAKRPAAPAREPTALSPDLLATLRQHTENLQQGVLPGGRATPAHPHTERPQGSPYGPGYSPPPQVDTTPSGLARRVRGAQLPTANPKAIRRAREDEARRAGGQRSPDEVYGFLSSFTDGVRRGLGEAERGVHTPPTNDGG